MFSRCVSGSCGFITAFRSLFGDLMCRSVFLGWGFNGLFVFAENTCLNPAWIPPAPFPRLPCCLPSSHTNPVYAEVRSCLPFPPLPLVVPLQNLTRIRVRAAVGTVSSSIPAHISKPLPGNCSSVSHFRRWGQISLPAVHFHSIHPLFQRYSTAIRYGTSLPKIHNFNLVGEKKIKGSQIELSQQFPTSLSWQNVSIAVQRSCQWSRAPCESLTGS